MPLRSLSDFYRHRLLLARLLSAGGRAHIFFECLVVFTAARAVLPQCPQTEYSLNTRLNVRGFGGALLGKLSAIISFQKRRFIGAKKVLKRAFMYVSIGEV